MYSPIYSPFIKDYSEFGSDDRYHGKTQPKNDSDLRSAAYEIFLALTRTSSAKPLSTAAATDPHNHHHFPHSPSSNSNSNSSPSLQRSLTSAAASKTKKALGLKSPGSGSKKIPGSGSGSGQGKSKKPLTIGELMRIQMRVPEADDSRVQRVLLRISAGQVSFLFFNCRVDLCLT
ncbi:unnamed protein product [Linum trigynum]|uniref:Uncharacterized protein n=1 Tax=Linum trigynum TaxID=586398 RepID=A0AAV2F5X2_9ROSI